MDINVVSDKPNASKLGPKINPETPALNMRVADFPKEAGRPSTNLCIVSPARPLEKTAGGIILHQDSLEAAEYACQLGRIEAVGPYFYNHDKLKELSEEDRPEVGDFVFFAPYSARRFCIDGNEFLILQEKDILMGKLDPSRKYQLFT